jgi:hypothetical protein
MGDATVACRRACANGADQRARAEMTYHPSARHRHLRQSYVHAGQQQLRSIDFIIKWIDKNVK